MFSEFTHEWDPHIHYIPDARSNPWESL